MSGSIDALESRTWATQVMQALAKVGVSAYLVLPIRLLRRRSSRADLRNHRKIAVVDGRVGYVGSQNIANADFNPRVTNQELVVRVSGPVVLDRQEVFVADWFLETDQVLKSPDLFPESVRSGIIVAQALPSGPDYPEAGVERVIEALIYGARERIVSPHPTSFPARHHSMRSRLLFFGGWRSTSCYLGLSTRPWSAWPSGPIILNFLMPGSNRPLPGQAPSR